MGMRCSTRRWLGIGAGVACAGLLAVGAVLAQPKAGQAALPASGASAAPAASAAAAASTASTASAPAPAIAASPANPAQARVERGRYLATMGDCIACHTAPGGAEFAGGRALQTPFGVILSANLTPDRETGIGRYDAGTFYRALHEGVDAEGRHLYPAFPYNYYTRVSGEDSDALFAYLQSLPPVKHPLQRNRLPFPFNIRALMAVWNWLYLDAGPYQPDPARSAQWNRGAYIAEGLGHCQACHTPRNVLGGPKDKLAFRGGRFADLFAPDLTPDERTGLGRWSDAALTEFLRAGRNVHGGASAEMGEVVGFSTSHLSDGDLAALVSYLRSLPKPPPDSIPAPDAGVMRQGEAIFTDTCSACHRMDGSGVPRYFPPLKGNANLQQHDPTSVLHFILNGTRHMPTARAPTPLSMPPFDWKLNDEQVAAVATYARNSWGNAAPAVTPAQVAELRKRLAEHTPRPPAPVPPSGMRQPGAATLAPAGTDSRQNGTPQAGQAAPGGRS